MREGETASPVADVTEDNNATAAISARPGSQTRNSDKFDYSINRLVRYRIRREIGYRVGFTMVPI